MTLPLLLLGSVATTVVASAQLASSPPAPRSASRVAFQPAAKRAGAPARFGTAFHGSLRPETRHAIAGVSVSAGPDRTPIGTFVVTCYDLSGTTATGARVGPKTVAVDPSVIPLGARIYVDGAGARLAQDTGGAVHGRRLDIWEPSGSQCAAWGVESRQVWIRG